MTVSKLTVSEIQHRLNQYPATNKYIIAFSGGLDSRVLLHFMSLVRSSLDAAIVSVHVNHGFSQESDHWSEFCRRISNQYGMDFKELNIEESCPEGVSIEAWAREIRYQLISSELSDGDILMTAHQSNDQVETILLHLLRGSGARGLSGMREIRKFGKGWHVRPMLDFSRAEILQYAIENKLSYVADESNQDTRYNRVFLRKNILPELKKRWFGLNKTLARVANNQLFITELLDSLGAQDFKEVRSQNGLAIDLDKFGDLNRQRQINLIIYWLRILDLPIPECAHIDEIIKNIILSNRSKIPCVTWSGVEIRRFRHMIYASAPLPAHDPDTCYSWDMNTPLTLSYGVIKAINAKGNGLAQALCKAGDILIRYRQGGEKIRPEKRGRSITIKNLFHEHAVMPWYRNRIPLLYINNALAAVPGFCIDDRFSAKKDEPSWHVIWEYQGQIIQST